MKTCKCEHWEVCPVCKPEWFDRWGNRLPPEPTPLQKANGRIEELEQQLDEREIALRQKLEIVSALLREAAGRMSYGHWSSEFRGRVESVLNTNYWDGSPRRRNADDMGNPPANASELLNARKPKP